MAYIVPTDLSQLRLADPDNPELDTLAFLKKHLPSDYTVFHGVHWSRSYENRTIFGEIDFVVINNVGDILVIEQKNGPLDETVSGLAKKYKDGRVSKPADQARRSLERVREKFKMLHGQDSRFAIDYLVYCPDYRVKNLNAAGLDPGRLVDGSNRNALAEVIGEILPTGSGVDQAWADRVYDFFAQTFEVVADIGGFIEGQARSYGRLNGELSRVIRNIEMSPMRLRLHGTAGCGKTQLVSELFSRAEADNQAVLLLCFSRPLRDKFVASLKPSSRSVIQTWHGFCNDFLEQKGVKLDFSKQQNAQNFWRDAVEEVIGHEVPEDWKFDTVIVDEGQDFEQDWWDVLSLFVRPDTDLFWLEDPSQNIYGKQAVGLDGFVTYRARDNFRSPYSIAKFIQANTDVEFECLNDTPGLGARVHRFDRPEDQTDLAANIVDRLLGQGFELSDIVIVSCRGLEKSTFSKLDNVGHHILSRFTSNYDGNGTQLWSEGELRFDTIYRFKGQQAPAIIVVDIEWTGEQVRQDRLKRLLYCAMTRATVSLDLLAPAEMPIKNERAF